MNEFLFNWLKYVYGVFTFPLPFWITFIFSFFIFYALGKNSELQEEIDRLTEDTKE